MKILLLEDNARLNATITKRLEAKGYAIDTFVDGKAAYDAMDNGYGCYILDINVPSLDGIEILKNVRDFYPETPVIIISSSVELEVIPGSTGAWQPALGWSRRRGTSFGPGSFPRQSTTLPGRQLELWRRLDSHK